MRQNSHPSICLTEIFDVKKRLGNIYVSQHYFGHSASKLTKREAALLAVCLPTPLKSNPGRPSRYLSNQASIVQGRMRMYGRINLDAKREDLNPRYLKMMDETLWDFVWWMLTDGESLKKR